MRQRRNRRSAGPLFLPCQKKWAKRGAGCGSDCTAVPQKGPVEERCGQHTRPFLQNYTTAPPAWGQRSHRKQLPRKEMAKHTAAECRTHLRMRRWCTVFTFLGADGERSRQRRRSATDAAYPLRVHIGPPPSIPEMSRNGMIAVCPQMRVVHSSEP